MFRLTPLAFCHMQDAVEALVATPFFNGLLICHRLPPLASPPSPKILSLHKYCQLIW